MASAFVEGTQAVATVNLILRALGGGWGDETWRVMRRWSGCAGFGCGFFDFDFACCICFRFCVGGSGREALGFAGLPAEALL